MKASILLALGSLGAAAAFVPRVHSIAGRRTRPATMSLFELLQQPPENAVGMYAASTFAGLATTAMLAPLVAQYTYTHVTVAEESDMCELIPSPAPTNMPQPLDADEEEQWWVCPGQELAANCREVFYDDGVQVACAW